MTGSQTFQVNAGDCYAIADEARYVVEHEVSMGRAVAVDGQPKKVRGKKQHIGKKANKKRRSKVKWV